MSFDIFLQRFSSGDPAEADSELIIETLAGFVVGTVAVGDVEITTGDGGADVYGLGSTDGIMVNHAAGARIWDAMVEVAGRARLAIIPVGCPTCVTDASLIDELPGELRQEARVVTTGEELLGVIRK